MKVFEKNLINLFCEVSKVNGLSSAHINPIELEVASLNAGEKVGRGNLARSNEGVQK